MVKSIRVKLAIIDNLIWFLCAGLYIFFIFVVPRGFLTFHNLEFILYVSSLIGFLVLGEAIVLISGNFDLSLAQNAGLCATTIGYLMCVAEIGLPTWAYILAIVLYGASLGMINGALVGKLRLNPFLVTLGTYLIFMWATWWIRRGVIVRLPELYLAPGSATVFGIHISIILLLAATAFLYYLLDHTNLGLWIRATGSDIETAERMGINTTAIIFISFTLAGLLAGVSGLLYTGYIGAVTSLIAEGKIFMAFAGAIIGGVSLKGGQGSIWGALGGIILLGILESGLTMLAVSPEIRGVLTGVIVIIAIIINLVTGKLRDRILMPK